MEKFGNFLWKIFSVTMVFLCHMGPEYAIAEDSENTTTPVKYIADDPKLTSEFFRSSDDARPQTATIRLCRSGEYLAKCGSSAPLGTNWLRGLDKKTTDGKSVTTPDFYSYKESSSDSIHMDNLRKFFSGKGNIEYTKKVGSGSSTSYSATHVSANEYVKYRNQILSNFCTNSNGDVADIVCNTCPNNAMVAESTVQKDSYDSGKILWDSWNVHTIADCYMQEFNDDSGTYVYVDDRTESSSNTNEGMLCYYSTNVKGSYLYYNK